MYMINVKAFIERETMMFDGKEVDCEIKVLEYRDDEATDYAILSHRWISGKEVDYKEMFKLAKMKKHEQILIRERDGYRKILASCTQAKMDGHDWLWVDTCCIDKRSSAELSEAINSMFRWYKNAKVCYAYLHDVTGKSFPTKSDKSTYPESDGWPEWFSRGWTLQEMIAPRNLQFFDKDWQPIGNKRALAHALSCITRVPEHILRDGLSSNRPCVAQIMSWAADRKTTRVEDRAYSLLGLLDVNMPMLYGEGKKAFHRLQLEIIHMSNDQSVFVWGFDDETRRTRETRRSGSILADDPSFFRDCAHMMLMDRNEFVSSVKQYIPQEEIEEDQFGTFLITNRGIHIWLLLRPCVGSDSVFEAWIPCCSRPSGTPVRITLASWNSDYYRYFTPAYPLQPTLRFCQVYLRYQDTPRLATFEIDDSAITENGFTYCGSYPSSSTENPLTLTSNDPLCVKVYSDSQTHCRFAVGFGQCFGQDWIHVECEESTSGYSREDYSRLEYDKMLVRGPEHARSMVEMCSRGGRYGRVWVRHACLPGSTRIVRTCCVMWEGSRNCGVMIDTFDALRTPYHGQDKWIDFDIEGTNEPNCDVRGLMIPHSPRNLFQSSYILLIDGISMEWSLAPKGIKLGDYGHLTDSEEFCYEGNIFTNLSSLTPESDIIPRQHRIDRKDGYNTDNDCVEAHRTKLLGVSVTLHKPLGLSLPRNHNVNGLLASLSTQLTNRYLVTRIIKCAAVPSSESPRQSRRRANQYRSSKFDPTTPLCIFAKPLVWHRDEGASFA
ncbi:heterokaryon incompatibility protein-domain-containing protein [Scleroderma yunnanense]